MKWTTNKPTKPGWYFIRFTHGGSGEPLVRELVTCDDPDLEYWNDPKHGNVDYLRDDPINAEYAGPIAEPSDDFDVYDAIKDTATKHGLSNAGIHTCFRLGFETYLEVIRLGGFFPHHK